MDNNEPIYKRSIGLIEATVEANCLEHGVRGILKHNDILKMIAEYTDEDMQARVLGKFQHLTGLVFKNFRRNIHVIDPFHVDPREFVTVEALDCHSRTQDAVMWVAQNRRGKKFVVDEIFKNYNSSGELAADIKARAGNYRIVKRIADPSAWNQDQHTGRSLFSDLYAMGIMYEKASKERQLAIRRTRDALHYRIENGEYIQTPELYIFNTCVRTLWEIEHWQYNEWKGKAAETKAPNDKPVDKDDHEMENLGRILLTDTVFEELQIEEPRYNPVLNNPGSPFTIDDPYSNHSSSIAKLDDPYA